MPDQPPQSKRPKLLGKELFVIHSELVKEHKDLLEILPEHFKYQHALEAEGTVFGAGPLENQAGKRSGMIIVRADSFEAAEAIANADPLHSSGVRDFTISKWTLNEGVLNLRVTFSGSTVDIA